MLTTRYELDVQPGGELLHVRTSQYDAGSRQFIFKLYSSAGDLVLPSDVQAEIRGTKPDGNGFSYTAAINGLNVTVDITEQMTAIAGKVRCELVLFRGTAGAANYYQLSTANFIMDVERAALDKDTLRSKSEIRQLVDIISQAPDIIAAGTQVQEVVQQMQEILACVNEAEENVQESAASASEAVSGACSEIEREYRADIAEIKHVHQEKLAETLAALAAWKSSATTEMSGSYEENMDAVARKFVEILGIKTAADNTAAQAVEIAQRASEMSSEAVDKATAAENDTAELGSSVDTLKTEQDAAKLKMAQFVADGYVDGGVAIFVNAEGDRLFEITGINGGGGGGGGGSSSGNNAVISILNTTGWSALTIAKGGKCEVSFEWSSIENEMETGNGSLRVSISGAVKATLNVPQGSVTVDVSPYLSTGANTVSLTVMDIYGNSRTIRVSCTVVELSLSSSFNASTPFYSSISFPYIPVGAVSKTVHFILDGNEIGTTTTSVSGRQQSFTVPQQSHGAHTLKCYFEAEVNGQNVKSNELYYEIICIDPLSTVPIIVSPFNQDTAIQYATLNIPFTVYDPNALTSEVSITANGTVVSEQTVDRTEQTFSYRANSTGELTVVITSGTASKTITVDVEESSIHVEAETEGLELHLTSVGRSNNEADPSVWKDTGNNISATLTGFGFTSDGWQLDDDGVTVLRVSGDDRVTIPHQIFAEDFRGTGKTIEVEFATRDVMDYDAVIMSCLSGGRGLSMTAQRATMTSEQSSISMQYKEDEHVRIGFVVEKRSDHRLMFVYVNGIMSGVVQYPTDDDFSQITPVGISIGSNDCTMDIYSIRVYDHDLTRHQMLENWIADTQNVDDMIERYNRNNVYDEYGHIIIENLPGSTPYMIIECEELPQYKGDKKTCNITYVDPVTPSKSFTAENVQIDVQGTSSQYYARKNFKIKCKNGFILANGSSVKKYALRAGEIATNVFCLKKDVASSEGANNVELAILFNDACPYKTPAQEDNSAVRQGIDGFPIVVFWASTSGTKFWGKYNFNLDKGSEDCFGFVDGDESWEVKNNTGNRVLFKSDDYTCDGWLNDFEARVPDLDPAYTDPTQLAEFASWVVSTDPDQATGNDLESSVTYGDGETSTTYTKDTAEYRQAKFRAELSDYVELDSAMFYYLFTELFLMVDSRAKNTFPSFIGTDLTA